MSKTQYNRILTGFGGLDVTNDDSNVELGRFPYLVNMWRDHQSENGAAIETFPGWRLIPWDFEKGTINGLYYAVFGKNKYVIIHTKNKLYIEQLSDIDQSKTLTTVATVEDAKSSGFQFKDAFYLLTGSKIHRITYDGQKFQASDISANPYIPTTYADGMEYEQRNMLTNSFYTRFNIQTLEVASLPNYGLDVRVSNENEKTAIAYGLESGREDITSVYVPDTCVINGTEYTITEIVDKAFENNVRIERAVIAESVKVIGENAFAGCKILGEVVIYGATEIKAKAFSGCLDLGILVLPKTIQAVASDILAGGYGNTTVIYSEASENSEIDRITDAAAIYYNATLIKADVGTAINIRLPDALDEIAIENINYIKLNQEATYVATVGSNNVSFQFNEECGILALALQYSAAPDGESTLVVTRHIFITVKNNDRIFNVREDENEYYRFDLYEPTRTVDKLTLDGKTVYTYATITEALNNKTYIRAVVLNGPAEELRGKQLIIQATAHESEFSRSDAGESFIYQNASYTGTSVEAIEKCTLWAEYDGRIFLAGNPDLPNTVFYSNRNLSGVNDPTYFGQLNYFNDGYGNNPIASLLSTPSFLAVIKQESGDNGTVYFHEPQITEYDVLPKIYPSQQGVAGVGSLGPAVNFQDDPVFLSREGVKGISISTVNNERGLYHRSTTVDKWMLAELEQNEAAVCDWNGYLVILVNGKIFLADSRQISKINGSSQYEWYFVDEVGVFDNQRKLYYFPSASPIDGNGNVLTDLFINGKRLEVKSNEDEYRNLPEHDKPTVDVEGVHNVQDEVFYVKEVDEDGEAHYYIVSSYGEMIEGNFSRATAISNCDGKLIFGTENGALCVVNTDKRGLATNGDDVPRDRIHYSWYTKNGRRYLSGFSTKKDNCGIPHYDKDTINRSLVIKAKTIPHSKFSVKLRTDREPWSEIQNASTAFADGYDVDFSNLSFTTSDEIIRQLRERSRRWVEKQYYVYSDEYQRPFGIYSIAYRYVISGLNGRIRRQ